MTELRTLLDLAPDAMVTVDAAGRVTAANERAEALFGASTLVGLKLESLLAKAPVPVEATRRDLDGDTIVAVREVYGERRFRAVLEAAPDAMVIVDENGTIALVNEQVEQLFGYPRAALVGQSVDMLVPDELRAGHGARRDHYIHSPRRRPMGAGLELSGQRADGSRFPVEISLSPLETEEGLLTISAIRDVSDRHRSLALSIRAEQQAAVVEISQAALAATSIDDLYGVAVRRMAEVLDVEYTEILLPVPDGTALRLRAGVGWPKSIMTADVPIEGTQTGAAFTSRETIVVEDFDDHERYPGFGLLRDPNVVSGAMVAIVGPGDRSLGVLGVHSRHARAFAGDELDFLRAVANVLAATMERARAAEALRLSQSRLQAVLDNSPALVQLKDLDGRLLVSNREVGPDGLDADERAVLAEGRPREVEQEVATPDGIRTYLSLKFPMLDEHGVAYAVGSVSTDITDRVVAREEQDKLQNQLDRSRRLESVGQLAGGIAHDFNNLLAVIMNFAGFVQSSVPADSPAADDIDQILQAARRAAELTRRLLLFSRRQPGRAEVLDLNASVTDIERILSRTLGEHIQLRVQLAPELWRVTADRGQLEQVLMNLAVNARDAMADGGVLTVETSNAMLDAEFARARGDDRLVGPFVELTVSDTGTGMSAETLERAFEPFYTTKPAGAGTGLGLATVYGIVQQAGGAVQLYSQPGSGTTVRVHLPATDAPAAESAVTATIQPPRGAGERILLVEDEAGVRAAARRILADAGYTVLEAPDGHHALELLAAQEAPIDLLLTDVVMPGLSGRELADQVRARDASVRVVFMSGYTDDVLLSRGTMDGEDAFVDKPFTAARLLETVRESLRHEN